jgi:hypothetical protein
MNDMWVNFPLVKAALTHAGDHVAAIEEAHHDVAAVGRR